MFKRYIGVFITYIFFILSTLYMSTPLITGQFEVSTDNALLYGKLIGSILAAVFILYLLIPDIKQGVSIDATTLNKSILWIGLGFFMILFAQIILGLINIYVFNSPMNVGRTVLITDRFATLAVIPMFISIINSVVFAPFFEELLCRKIIFGVLFKKTSFIFASLISSFIFAIAHLEFNNLLPFAATGVILSFIYVKTKRIIVPIITHSLINSFIFIGTLLQ